jgi:hypothetical protein
VADFLNIKMIELYILLIIIEILSFRKIKVKKGNLKIEIKK